MVFNIRSGSLGKFFAASVLAATLAACGSSSQDGSSSASSATTTGAIRTTGANATTQEVVALSAATYTTAPASTVQVSIDRRGPSHGAATVGYATINGTAYAGVDYQSAEGSVTWEDGDTTAKIITVPVMSQANGKTFSISLISVDGDAAFGTPASATIQVATPGSSSSSSSSSGASATSGSTSSANTSTTTASTTTASTTTTSSSGSSSGSTSNTTSSSGGSSSGGSSSSGSSSGGSSSSSGSTTASTATASLSWTAPTENTNGSALTNLSGYTIYYGTSASAMTNQISITTVGLVDYTISNLAHGTWYFAINAVSSAGTESALSGTVSITL